MKRFLLLLAATALTVAGHPAAAGEMVFEMHRIDEAGVGPAVGPVNAEDVPYGLGLTPGLRGPSDGHGLHGFHVHENPDCGPGVKDGKTVPGLAAGGHFDPSGSGRHEGPYGEGHLGDLPSLYVGPDGTATTAVLAPRLASGDLKGRSLIVHLGGDNYADHPMPLGGGGARMICGVERP